MTNKEARKVIGIMPVDKFNYKEEEAIMVACRALDEIDNIKKFRTPTKPLCCVYDDDSKVYGCPNCKRILPYKWSDYCGSCGQAIDWGFDK